MNDELDITDPMEGEVSAEHLKKDGFRAGL